MIVQKTLNGKTVATYKSKAEAARILGVDESTIRKGIKFNRKVLNKFLFFYVEDAVVSTNTNAVKILVVDIETAPIKAYTWGLWQQNIFLDQIISNWFMLSWSAKWIGNDNVMSMVLLPSEVQKENDYNIVVELWKLLDEADIVVAHNGDKFDIPKMNSRFLYHGFPPPSSYRQIDTKKIAKNYLGESSTKLEALARKFGFEGKYDTDFNLWKDCMDGDMEALIKMSIYNEQDVRILEKVYLKLRPYAKGHPNFDVYVDGEEISCPHCGHSVLKPIKDKFFYTQANKYQLYRCSSCSTISRSKTPAKFNHKRNISAIPR